MLAKFLSMVVNMADAFEGKRFQTVEEAKKFIDDFNTRHFTNFIVLSNNKRQLVFKCKHGYDRKSQSGGKRPQQHYNNLDCEAFVRLYKGIPFIKVLKPVPLMSQTAD